MCRSLFLNFTCECLTGSYYGLYCENTATKVIIYQIISKSFAYIAIIAMITVATFIVVMDILKYYFGIDPTRHNKCRCPVREIKRTEKVIFPSVSYIKATL